MARFLRGSISINSDVSGVRDTAHCELLVRNAGLADPWQKRFLARCLLERLTPRTAAVLRGSLSLPLSPLRVEWLGMSPQSRRSIGQIQQPIRQFCTVRRLVTQHRSHWIGTRACRVCTSKTSNLYNSAFVLPCLMPVQKVG